MEKKNDSLRNTAYSFIIIIGVVVIFAILRVLQDIFIPFVIAYFLFFVFSPLNEYLEKKKIPIWGAIGIDILIMLLIFGGISSIIVDSFSRFGAALPQYEKKLNDMVVSFAASVGIDDPALKNFNLSESLKKIDYKFVAGNVFTSTFSLLGSLLFIIFFFIFVVTGHVNIYNAIRKRILHRTEIEKEEDAKGAGDKRDRVQRIKDESIKNTFRDITKQVQKYIVTKFFISLATAVIEGIAIWIFGVDFVIVWAVLIFVLNFIPNVGSIIGLALPCLMALVQFDSITTVIFLAVVLFVLDTIMGNVVEPKVFGVQLGLNPIIILLSLLLWGYIWGIIGALLSVPLTAVFKIIISRSASPNLIFLSDLMGTNSKT